MITKTFEQVRMFNITANAFIKANPYNQQTKLGYAIKKLANSTEFKKCLADYRAEFSEAGFNAVEAVQIENALTDEKTKAILLTPKGSDRPYMYDKEGLKKVMIAERKWEDVGSVEFLAAWDKKEFQFEPYLASEIPVLSADEVEAFKGFVIPEETEYVEPTPVVAEEVVEPKVEEVTA